MMPCGRGRHVRGNRGQVSKNRFADTSRGWVREAAVPNTLHRQEPLDWGRMTRPPAFHYLGVAYDLTHLNPFDHAFIQDAQGDKPERRYDVQVIFGHHCFTEAVKPGDNPALFYAERREQRTFNVIRWELSRYLPTIIRGLMRRQVTHTHHGNFFVVELLSHAGDTVEYEVYFEVGQPSGKLSLIVTSAFPRDPARIHTRAKRRPIAFGVILYNTLTGRPIRAPGNTGRRF